jgi:hypothetical protein
MNFFVKKPKPGRPLSLKGISDGLLAIEKAWQSLAAHNGHIDWDKGRPTIVMDDYEEQATRLRNFLPDDYAWRQIAGEDSVMVSHGPVPWGDTLVDELWYMQIGDAAQEVAFPSTDSSRWLFVEVLLSSATVTVKFADNANFPQHDLSSQSNLIYRFPLSLWARVTSEDDPPITLVTRTFSLNRYPEIPGWAPTRAS